ncbi:CDK-activating kinase assembly factor MAT1 [Trichodelitschia bisporula]|uniref:RNA polymerase II transcription factor B subunit 3 n=1 Tax=Trichodelitschia bisporula TaxID=703511 RepID=A0A6G1HS18_9PEZI|nr:CDK-activating kinase assembly factor MAT1 [Trichodelitschia bisporula]
MSRTALHNDVPERIHPEDGDEECPICHSKRYLRRDMRFLINPECYHRMCESCIDRIFSHGPAPCPVAGCGKTLRRHRFRAPTFQDLQLEREVDIRKRVSQVFNKQEDDFDTLLDYNNYLNDVEDITHNLIHNIEVDAMEQRLREYEAANRQAITENSKRSNQGMRDEKRRLASEKEQARLRQQSAASEAQAYKAERDAARRNVISQLATGRGDADTIARRGQTVLKKSKALREQYERRPEPVDTGFQVKGLKKTVKAGPVNPYDPFDGLTAKHEYGIVHDNYRWQPLEQAKKDRRIMAGGYDIDEYCSRMLTDLYVGFGVFVGEDEDVATAGAGMAAMTDTVMTDVS